MLLAVIAQAYGDWGLQLYENAGGQMQCVVVPLRQHTAVE